MAKKRNNRKRRVFILALSLLITTVMFATSSYAWFTANKNVSVEQLQVKVEAKNGIQISTNAVDWKSIIQKTDIFGATGKYQAAVNQIPATMQPVSTAGKIDSNAKLEMFYGEISNNLDGDYVLATTQEEEEATDATHLKGKYIAFDLFFKVNAQSKLYVQPNSGITAAAAGGQGIENAARIGFAILGNADSSTDPDTLRTLGTNQGDEPTFYMWEPNYDVHTGAAVQHALATYNLSINESGEDALAYYGVAAEGTDILVQTDMTNDQADYLHDYPTLFDTIEPDITTEKDFATEREIFTLQPGVTKVRIYVWVEGQDVDCENDASGGTINFDLSLRTPTLNE